MRFEFKQIASWPPLAWLARVQRARDTITVWHGSRVECSDKGFCEAVWDGDFSALDFDRTDLIFGSGCRLRDNRATFVSSGSTVDRLHLYRGNSSTDISNSLACIAEVNNVGFDPTYPHYQQDFWSIEYGLDRVITDIRTSGEPVTLVYFRNVVWDGESLAFEDKPFSDRRFVDFDSYEGFLATGMAALAENMRSGERHHGYDPLGTLSTGYDSSTVAVLGLPIDCRKVICFQLARDGHSDDGSDNADRLGLDVISANRDAWRQLGMAEIPFMASNAYGEEVQFATVADQLLGKVMFTGFHGDVAWSKELLDSGSNIVRGDCTGLSLTEFRLWYGFIHCPVPFWGARNVASINAISNSDEMKSWDIPGDYSRPICRRIVESAAIPRETFGMMKKAASTIFKWESGFLSRDATASYSEWLGRHRTCWLRKGRLPPQWRPHFAIKGVSGFFDLIIRVLRRLRMSRIATFLVEMRQPATYPFIFPWAMHHAKQRYRVNNSSQDNPTQKSSP